MFKYRKKPVEIEAVQWSGENNEEIKRFLGVGDAGDYFFTRFRDVNSDYWDDTRYALSVTYKKSKFYKKGANK